MKQGVFISYRRDTGDVMATLIYNRLCLIKGYQCFLDVKGLDVGDFRKQILEKMDCQEMLLAIACLCFTFFVNNAMMVYS